MIHASNYTRTISFSILSFTVLLSSSYFMQLVILFGDVCVHLSACSVSLDLAEI